MPGARCVNVPCFLVRECIFQLTTVCSFLDKSKMQSFRTGRVKDRGDGSQVPLVQKTIPERPAPGVRQVQLL